MMGRMKPSTARIVAWGVLLGLLAVGAAFVAVNRVPRTAPDRAEVVARNVKVAVSPNALRTGATTTVTVTALDGEGGAVSAWEGSAPDVWLVRSDLVYATRARSMDQDATSSFAVDLRPTQPGSYRLAAAGATAETVTMGGATVPVSGPAEDVPPEEQSAGREGFKVVMSTIPDGGALRAGEPVSVTLTVSRTGTPVPLVEEDGVRGSLVAFREGGGLFVRGEPPASAYLPSASSAAFTLVFPDPGRYRLFFEFAAGGRRLMEARWIEVGPAR